MVRILALQPYENSDRVRTSKIMCSVAFEHAESLKLLLASGNFTSAVGLLRLQFEAFVRATWLFYVAPDIAVGTLSEDMNSDSLERAE